MIHLLIVHEFKLMCNIIATVLEDEADIHVAGSATTLQDALDRIARGRIDIVLCSTRLPDDGALKLTRALLKDAPQVKIIALGLAEHKGHILEFIEAGVNGYVLRENSLEELIETIRAVQRGQAIVSPEIAAALIERITTLTQAYEQIGASLPEAVNLTERELQVLQLLNRGLSNREIADRLVIEVGTVKNHVHNILEKLGVSSREEAATLLALVERQIKNNPDES
jgi:DNA-binding NarL/FixJ family response regulator